MKAQRMVYAAISLTIAAGIFLTGYDQVHWILYIPVVMTGFAAITGICPGFHFWKACGLK